MKAVLLRGFGGPEVLKLGQAEKPSPSAGQVLIRVIATSVNRPDIVQREGNYPPPKGDSEILGLEVSGVVDEVGEDVSGWSQGDRVMALVGGGGYAEYAVAYACHCMRIPESMSFAEAACVCETYITAFLNIFMIGGLSDGDTIVLHGGGGGVNTAGIQLCKTLTPDARIIVTASKGKIDRVKELGVHFVVDYKEQDFAEEVRNYTKKKGASVIIDHIGAEYLSANMRALGVEGKLVIIGIMSGGIAEINLGLLMVKRQQVIGSVLRSRSVQEKANIISAFTESVLPNLADGTITPIIDRIFPIAEVAQAHRTMEAGTHFGKIVLTIGSDIDERET